MNDIEYAINTYSKRLFSSNNQYKYMNLLNLYKAKQSPTPPNPPPVEDDLSRNLTISIEPIDFYSS